MKEIKQGKKENNEKWTIYERKKEKNNRIVNEKIKQGKKEKWTNLWKKGKEWEKC